MATILPANPSAYIPFVAATSRTAAVNVAFSAIHLLIGSALCLVGRRAWRMTCAISLGLAFELIAAAVIFNILGTTGFKESYSARDNDLAAFGIIVGAGLAGLLLSYLLPRKWACGWWLGWAFLGPLAGMSVAFAMMMMKGGEDLLIGNMAGRWILVALLALVGLAAVTMTKWIGATIAVSILGTWLLALGVDLALNTNRGASLGLRKILDENALHQETLREYNPALSTNLLFGLSWALAILFASLQWYLNKDRWFLPLQPAPDRRGWKHWLCPYLLRSSTPAPRATPDDIEKSEESPLTDASNDLSKPTGSAHSRQNSTPDSAVSTEADLAERGSLASGSDLRALTRNYRRALEILESSEDGHQTADTRGTVPIPIQYRPAPLDLQAPPNAERHDRDLSPTFPHERYRQAPLLKPVSPARPSFRRTGPSSPGGAYRTPYGQAEQGNDEVPDLGALLKRADSDRGTSYSIPLTNITSSEYRDRDMFRPPSWTGDLPWHPSMLRGDLDPATLPRHPQDAQIQNMPVQAGHGVSAQPVLPEPYKTPIAGVTPTSKAEARESTEVLEDEFEMVKVEGVAQNGKPDLRISQPFQMPYASRPVSREGSPGPLASLGPPGRTIQKTQRTPTRERRLLPSEDDLPDHTPSTPDGAVFPAIGHSRLHTSDTYVDSPHRSGRDENATEVDTSGDDGERADYSSSHASYSMSNFKSHNKGLAARWKGKSAQKHTPTESSESEGNLPLRPITQSDMTPQLQDAPSPAQPRLVYNSNAPVSNVASLTGTPRSSGAHFFGQGSNTPPMPNTRSEVSETTAKPGQEQRRSMELERLAGNNDPSAVEGDGKKVRFFESGSRKTLRDRLLRRQ